MIKLIEAIEEVLKHEPEDGRLDLLTEIGLAARSREVFKATEEIRHKIVHESFDPRKDGENMDPRSEDEDVYDRESEDRVEANDQGTEG